MGQLEVRAINPRMEMGFFGFALALVRGTRWDLTCGFCRRPFRSTLFMIPNSADCPYCGTRNLLPGRPRLPRGM